MAAAKERIRAMIADQVEIAERAEEESEPREKQFKLRTR